MLSKTQIIILCLLAPLLGCANPSAGYSSPAPLTLETADTIQVGIARLQDLKQKLGNPATIFDSKPTSTDALLFCEKTPCTQGHITCHTDKKSGVVKSVTWNPQSGDSDTLEAVTAHYKDLTFKKQRLLYRYADYFDEVETYTNKEHGITIGFNPYKKKVTQVYRENPNEPMPTIASGKKFPVITVLPERDTASPRGVESQ